MATTKTGRGKGTASPRAHATRPWATKKSPREEAVFRTAKEGQRKSARTDWATGARKGRRTGADRAAGTRTDANGGAATRAGGGAAARDAGETTNNPTLRGDAAGTPRGKTSPAEKQAAVGEVGIRVRMYRVGFGDCFLVSFPAANGSKAHVLIDCGVFKGTTGKGDINCIEEAVDDIAKETDGKLALVVMTHRHADHIAGFSRCADKFAGFRAEAVWMPSWESEYAPAQKFQEILAKVASRLQAHLEIRVNAGANDEEHRQALDMLYDATGVDGSPMAVIGKASNAESLKFLKTGLGAAPSYYGAGDDPKLPPSLANAGVSARILGPPPIEDIDLMKLMDLQKGVGQYLDADGGSEEAQEGGEFAPFGKIWCEDEDACYPKEAFKEWAPRDAGDDKKKDFDEVKARQRMEKGLAQLQPMALLMAAKGLDSFLNNQSLVILFTFKGKKLLFVGDAQAGNWEHWLYGTDVAQKAPRDPLSADAAAILGALDFYKVGHHGSTNATPIAAVSAMRQNNHLVAMCSTQEEVYGKPDNGSEVPRIPLMKALGDASDLVRSDQIEVKAVDGKVVAPGAGAPKALPKPRQGRLNAGELWIDCFL